MSGRPEYQREPVELAPLIWTQGFITALQVMRIAAWKSARGLAPLTMNSENQLRERTELLVETLRPWRKVDVLGAGPDSSALWPRWTDDVRMVVGSKVASTGLLGLSGFGYPMATAFLALLAPAAFPVIDRWTVRAIYGRGTSNYQRAHIYAHFTQQLAIAAHHYPKARTIHEVDQHVMNDAMRCDHSAAGCDCLPFEPVDIPTAHSGL